jgi:hypothetical protein
VTGLAPVARASVVTAPATFRACLHEAAGARSRHRADGCLRGAAEKDSTGVGRASLSIPVIKVALSTGRRKLNSPARGMRQYLRVALSTSVVGIATILGWTQLLQRQAVATTPLREFTVESMTQKIRDAHGHALVLVLCAIGSRNARPRNGGARCKSRGPVVPPVGCGDRPERDGHCAVAGRNELSAAPCRGKSRPAAARRR